ncbi:molecular chaperone [Burkholderia ubonensis]|uniref:fimbrial biogenesis chaperone n=1 Tax=Burkholderia ubonensis TaxID=101571 RepID=UPI0018AD2E1D|nr:molecular chaperone [Burkholderia ubonensis]
MSDAQLILIDTLSGISAAAMRTGLILLTVSFASMNSIAQPGAGLFLSATRLVFPAASHAAALQIYNENTYPVVVQTWVDDGEIAADPAAIDAPFVILPPLMRLQPHEARAVRIVYSQQPLPKDRESVFWFNVQMIPPNPDHGDPSNVMDVSVRIRQKIFFRPEQLTGGSAEWIGKLVCWQSGRSALAIDVRCHNPTPYFATVDHLSIAENDTELSAPGGMLTPFGEMTFQLNEAHEIRTRSVGNRENGRELHLAVIDDEGHVRVIVQRSLSTPSD